MFYMLKGESLLCLFYGSIFLQDVGEITSPAPTPSTTQIDLAQFGVAIGSRKLSVKAIDNRHQLPSYSNNNNNIVEDIVAIKEKYAPFIPQLRPWLVIIEVNSTDDSLNTECTG